MKALKDMLIASFYFFSILLFAIVMTALLSACGPQHVVIDPVTVNHKVDFSSLLDYFKKQCQEENPYSSPQEQDACANDKLTNLLNAFKG